jgi:hypothetical protein
MTEHHWSYKWLITITKQGTIGITAVTFAVPVSFVGLPFSEFSVLVAGGIGIVGGLSAILFSAAAIDPSSTAIQPEEGDVLLKAVLPAIRGHDLLSQMSEDDYGRAKRFMIDGLNSLFSKSARYGQSVCERAARLLLFSTILGVQSLSVRYAVQFNFDLNQHMLDGVGISGYGLSHVDLLIHRLGMLLVFLSLSFSMFCGCVASMMVLDWLWSTFPFGGLSASSFRCVMFEVDGSTVRKTFLPQLEAAFRKSIEQDQLDRSIDGKASSN